MGPFRNPSVLEFPSARPRMVGCAVAAALVLALGATPARAEFVTATFSDVNPGEIVTINNTVNGVTTTESGWAGVYNFKNASGALSGSYKAFCIEIAQDIFTNQTATWSVNPLENAPLPGPAMGTVRANLVGQLWDEAYAAIGTDNTKAAAFQIAIWEIENETTLSNGQLALGLGGGSFSVTYAGDASGNVNTAAVVSQANAWLSGLDLSGSAATQSRLIALENDTYQDYVTTAPVPEPGTLSLAGVGVVGLAAYGWRRRRRAA